MNQRKLTKKKVYAKNLSVGSSDKSSESALIKDTQVIKTSQFLSNTKITIIGGGGIAATELPKLARELRRQGAEVQFCITENCLKFIGIESLRWASNNEVIINPSGLAEHICTSDAIVVSPATADLISKTSNGICSDGATTLIQSALGMSKTIIFCPTMHESLSFSPIIEENKEKLKKMDGVFFTNPRIEEGKEKLPLPNILAINICHIINKRKYYSNKIRKVLLTIGGTRAMIDPVRCVTNLSTGSLGIEVAKTFYAMGIETTVLCANTNKEVPEYDQSKILHLPNYNEMYDYLKEINHNKYDGILHLVAGSDFSPKSISNSKISSKEETLRIDLIRAKKILDIDDLSKISFKAAAKLTSGSEIEGLEIAKKMLINKKLSAVLHSTSDSAWNKEKEHHGTIIKNTNGHIEETCVNGKKEMAVQFYLSFKDFFDNKNE